MKTLFLLAAILLPSLGGLQANPTETEFKVYGACGMCKDRIETAAMIDGVSFAEWSQDEQMLTLRYDAEQVELEKVHQRIADAGHDTEKVRADDEVYNSLPACCKYERKNAEKAEEGSCCSS